MQTPSKIILGIDPGTLMMGYGIIKIEGKTITLIEMGVLKLSGKKDNYERLQKIHFKVRELVEKNKADEFAIEAPFFGKNVQSMLKLGRAQGVAIAAAMNTNIPVTEYSPKKVKQSITGNGSADKEQVWKMLQRLLHITEKPKHYDATDALAVAVCHHFQNKSPLKVPASKKKISQKKKTSWLTFVANNPERINRR